MTREPHQNVEEPRHRGTPPRIYKVLALVDESNLLGVARTFNRRLDWLRIRNYLADSEEGREPLEFVIYVGLPPSMPAYQDQRDKKLKFVHWLRANGFLVVTKDGSPTEDGRYKANVDVMMAIDGIALATEMRPDIVVLVTGDSDFAHLALTLRRRGIRVEVAAIDQNLGNELKNSANSIIDLHELFNQFEELGDDVYRRSLVNSAETRPCNQFEQLGDDVYSLGRYPHLDPGPMRELFEEFRKQVLALDSRVKVEYLKKYVAFKAETNFVDVVPQLRRLQLILNMAFPDINDPEHKCRDVSRVGHYGNGEVEVGVTSLHELPYVMGLVGQSFEKQMGSRGDWGKATMSDRGENRIR